MAGMNKMRALNRLPYDFEDGLKIAGVDVTILNQMSTANGAGLVGFTPVGNLGSTNVQAAIAELDVEKVDNAALAASAGSSLVGYDGSSVQAVLDSAKPISDYTALRAYTGRATSVRITSNGIAGFFYYDASDTTSADNGGTVIVSGNGKRWKRLFDGAVNVKWFGAKGDWNGTTGTDDTVAIQNAVNDTPYGEILFTSGNYKITSPITINTDSQAGLTRRDRIIVGSGAVITCAGIGQVDGFVFSAGGPWPATSFSLRVSGMIFGGTVSRAFISIPNADNFFEQLLFEKVSTTNTGAGTVFYFKNGTVSNLGGVTIRKCSGGPTSVRFIQMAGSATYGQFDDWTIEDCFHLGTGSFLYLDGTTATTTLQYSQIRRCFSAGVSTRGINGTNQYITNTIISNFYAEPKQTTWVSVDCELIDCVLENVVNTVANFSGKDIKVLSSGAAKDTKIVNCRSYNGTVAPWESATYVDVLIAYPTNVSISGSMERFFNNAVSYTKPYIFPGDAQSVRLCSVGNDGFALNTTGTKTLYTFTNSAGGINYDSTDEIFEIVILGQLLGGVTNFSMSLQLHDGTSTETLTTVSTNTLNNNARHFKFNATIRVTAGLFQTLYAEGNLNGSVFGKVPYTYVERGLVSRANNPVLRINVTTLDAQAVEINLVKIVRNKRVGAYTWV